MFTVSWIITISILVVSFFGVVISALLFTKPVDEYKFSFLRIFPFEAIRNSENNGKIYSFFTFLFSGMAFTPIILIVEGSGKLSNLNPLSIFIACVIGLAGVCFVFLNFFDVTHTKPHLVLFAIFALLTLLSGVLVVVRGFTAFDLLKKHGSTEYFLIICSAACVLATLPVLAFIVNPKLKDWPRLDQVDGEYVRPKHFVLAYSEWGIFLSLFLIELCYFVQILIK